MSYIKCFSEIGIEDVKEVGRKNASLGEMYQNMTKESVCAPNGFAITANAYRSILDFNNVWDKLHEQIDNIDINDVKVLQE